jgi:hypothetical protein
MSGTNGAHVVEKTEVGEVAITEAEKHEPGSRGAI